LTSIVVNAHAFALLVSLQSYSALMLRPHQFDFNRLRRSYLGLASFAAIVSGAYPSASPV
jgi:hypothetical protein